MGCLTMLRRNREPVSPSPPTPLPAARRGEIRRYEPVASTIPLTGWKPMLRGGRYFPRSRVGLVLRMHHKSWVAFSKYCIYQGWLYGEYCKGWR